MTNEIRKNNYINLIVGAAILAVVAVYAFSPIDIVPDFFVGLGQIDDGIVIILGIISEIVNAVCGAICSCNERRVREFTCDYGTDSETYGEYWET